jgi:hypothetical protein
VTILSPKSKERISKERVVLTRKVLGVALVPNVSSGLDEYDISNFKPNRTYKVFGAVWVRYSDGSGVPCWLVETESGAVEAKAMGKFKVVEEKPL